MPLARPRHLLSRPLALSLLPRPWNSQEMQVFIPLTPPPLSIPYNSMLTSIGMQTLGPLLIWPPIATGSTIIPPNAILWSWQRVRSSIQLGSALSSLPMCCMFLTWGITYSLCYTCVEVRASLWASIQHIWPSDEPLDHLSSWQTLGTATMSFWMEKLPHWSNLHLQPLLSLWTLTCGIGGWPTTIWPMWRPCCIAT